MSLLKKLFVLVLTLNVVNLTCLDSVQYHLGTKSPYRFVGNKEHSKINYDGCKPGKIWMITRHGTRNPSAKQITVMNEELPVLRDQILRASNDLLKSDLNLLEKWKPKLDESDQKHLTSEGYREMVELGERMQARFPDLLPEIYSSTWYSFRFTKTQRTKASAINYAIGLFGKATAKSVEFPDPLKQDPILRFYKLCTKWRDTVKKNPKAVQEMLTFWKSARMMRVVRNIEKNLGLSNGTLTFEHVFNMYTTCAFETAWNRNGKSPWCAVFDMESIEILEYAEDLKYYWVDGYGYPLTYRQACTAFNDMYTFLNATDPYPKATLYFTHSGTILKLISHLGLHKDELPLRHDNIDPDRKWKVSKMNTFGSNLAFVSFNCKGIKKLLLLHNEHVIRFPACPNTDLCSLNEIAKYYSDSITKCDFDEMCELNK